MKHRAKGEKLVRLARRHLNYDPDTGVFTWRTAGPGHKKGRPAGFRTKDGYIAIKLKGHCYVCQRLAFVIMDGEEPPEDIVIDHINGDRTDNRWANLRAVSIQDNARNKGKLKNKTSRYIGVTFESGRGKWRAFGYDDTGKKIHIGYFDTEEEAATARLKWEEQTGWIRGQDHNVRTILEDLL